MKFLDAAHVKDALALLRFAENPRDRVAGFRVAQLLPGVGPAIAETIVAAAAADDGFAALAALASPARARAGFAEFAALMRRLARAPRPGRAISPTPSPGGAPLLETRYDDARARSATSTRWSASPATFPRASVS